MVSQDNGVSPHPAILSRLKNLPTGSYFIEVQPQLTLRLISSLSGNCNLHLDTRLDVDDDLLDDLGRRVQVNQPLVDPHFVHVPSLASLAAGGLSRGDLQRLRGQAHGALDTQVLRLGALEQLAAHFLQRRHLARRERDADLVDFLYRAEVRET